MNESQSTWDEKVIDAKTKRELSIPKDGAYLVIEYHSGTYLCLLLFEQSKKDSTTPHSYVVKFWHPTYGFFTNTMKFIIEYSKVKRFNSFKKAIDYYEKVST